MKKFIFLMLMLPLMAVAQNKQESRIFESAILTPKSGEVDQLQAGLKAHNKKYHSEGDFGARVYWIANGRYTGSYKWVMGSFPWSAMDNEPWDAKEHAADWNKNVQAHITPWSGDQSYWKVNPELSQFPKDFKIKNMQVTYYDIARGKYEKAMKLVKKAIGVNQKKMPDETFAFYTNQFPSTKEGRDIAIISFFDKATWLDEGNTLKEPYEETYGEGSWGDFIEDWIDVTNGSETELWIYLPDLSGKSGEVKGSASTQK